MIVIGCDTGLANFGLAVCGVDHETKTIRLLHLDLFVSQPIKHTVTIGKRGGITKTRDTAGANFDRTLELVCWLRNHCEGATCICFESMSTGADIGAPASLLMGAAFGAMAATAMHNTSEVEFNQHTPQQVKNGLGLKNNATKDQVHDALLARFPNLDDILLQSFRANKFFDYDENCTDGRAKAGYNADERSHPCDALATIVATWPNYRVAK